MSECDSILKHVHLRKFEVDCFQRDKDLESKIVDSNNNANLTNTNTNYNKIKYLQNHWRDAELRYIMNAYTDLNVLEMDGLLENFERVAFVSTSVMILFLEFAMKIESCYVYFNNISSANWLMDMYQSPQEMKTWMPVNYNSLSSF
jgi:hypothetical protein